MRVLWRLAGSAGVTLAVLMGLPVMAQIGAPTTYGCLSRPDTEAARLRLLTNGAEATCLNGEMRVEFLGLGVVWRGGWSADRQYEIGDAVAYQGASYLAVQRSKVSRPLNSGRWHRLAAKGDLGGRGDAGSPGAQGSAGPTGETGPAGLQGAPGPQGPIGPAGAQGPQGQAGEQGLGAEDFFAGMATSIGPTEHDITSLPAGVPSFIASRDMSCMIQHVVFPDLRPPMTPPDTTTLDLRTLVLEDGVRIETGSREYARSDSSGRGDEIHVSTVFRVRLGRAYRFGVRARVLIPGQFLSPSVRQIYMCV